MHKPSPTAIATTISIGFIAAGLYKIYLYLKA